VKWLRDVLQNGDSLVKGEDGVALANLRKDTAEGKALLASAKHILKSLGKEAAVITVADTEKTAEVFAKAKRNGDGIVPPTPSTTRRRAQSPPTSSPAWAATDRSGKPGYDQGKLDAFFAACADFDAWQKLAEPTPRTCCRSATATAAAYAAFSTGGARQGRRLLRPLPPRRVRSARAGRGQPRAGGLHRRRREGPDDHGPGRVAHFPLAHVEANKPLPLQKGVNPAWAGAAGGVLEGRRAARTRSRRR
jgi:hypothetical protein